MTTLKREERDVGRGAGPGQETDIISEEHTAGPQGQLLSKEYTIKLQSLSV